MNSPIIDSDRWEMESDRCEINMWHALKDLEALRFYKILKFTINKKRIIMLVKIIIP